MAHEGDTLERLWQDYAGVFRGFDDLQLARWMSQTLGQLHGSLWRMSHPLVDWRQWSHTSGKSGTNAS